MVSFGSSGWIGSIHPHAGRRCRHLQLGETPLELMPAVMFCIAIGIAVDDTIHFSRVSSTSTVRATPSMTRLPRLARPPDRC